MHRRCGRRWPRTASSCATARASACRAWCAWPSPTSADWPDSTPLSARWSAPDPPCSVPPMAADDLEASLSRLLGGDRIEGLRRLSGGASRETWSFDAIGSGGGRRELILRRDPPGSPKGMALEARMLRAAAGAGVPVPAVLESSDDPALLGSAFIVMDRIAGETIGRRILREPEYDKARSRLARQCGEILAHLHSIDADAIEGLE